MYRCSARIRPQRATLTASQQLSSSIDFACLRKFCSLHALPSDRLFQNHKFKLYAASSRFAIPSKGEPWPIPFVPNAAICAEADHPPIALSSSDMILASFDTNRSRKRLIVLLSPLPDDRGSHPRRKVQPLRLSVWRSIQSEARRTEMRGNGGSVPSLRELLPLQG